jgi:Fe-S-cluster containining protein
MPQSVLCRACGFCCDGTLFQWVRVEREAAVAWQCLSPHQRDDGSWGVRMPCAALGSDGCRVYPDRPSECRRYECLLYRALSEGELALGAALAIVAEARRRRGREGEAAYLRFHFVGQKRR